MIAIAVSVLVASLLGSLHCAGMCGGFVALYAGAPSGLAGATAGHVLYNLGRLSAYAALGAIAGALGETLDRGGALLGVQRMALVVTGAFITVWGTMALLESFGRGMPRVAAPLWLVSLMKRGVGRLAGWSAPSRAFAIGVLTGGLPCGWLYAFLVTAAGTGRAATGAALMIVFWLGTLPAMVAVGIGVRRLAGSLRRYVPAACALAMILVGLLALTGRVVDFPLTHARHAHQVDHASR